MACVKVADKLSDKAKKQKKTRDCVVKNYAYFTPDFCEKMLERADLLGDQELRKTCTERHEKLPSTVTPASSGAAKNRK